uniref:Plant heme peroxidase family profile domain-containing protein n=1 Tax=Physcomitrium patens TaxID=3218 RepID=A0A2K1IR41_PHYPA|nr:hypothetical protein PHYPA_025869 [Physcomitrium patens]
MTRKEGTMRRFSSLTVILLAMTLLVCSGISALREGFYSASCPRVEDVNYKKMQEIRANDADLYPVILRLHFHDCFIRRISMKLPNAIHRHNCVHSECKNFQCFRELTSYTCSVTLKAV